MEMPSDTTPTTEQALPAGEAPAKKAAPSKPRWETEARERLKGVIRRFQKPLADLIARDANEGDTRLFITDFLCDGLGYDKYEDLTTEYMVKGEFADYGIRMDKQLVAFVEVKRCTTKLTAKHLRQVEMYAVNEGVEWLILTNGAHWQVYHLSAGLPVAIDLAIDADLSADATVAAKAHELFYLTKESLKRRQIDELWELRAATSPKSLTLALLSEPVADALRKELRRNTGQNIDAAELVRLVRDTVIRPECLS